MRRWLPGLVALTFLLGVCAFALSAEKSADEQLKARGLVRIGGLYLLADDVKLPEGLKALRLTKKQCEEAAKNRAALEKEMEATLDSIDQLRDEYDKMKQLLDATKDVPHHNALVPGINRRVSSLREAQAHYDECKLRRDNMNDPQNAYIDVVVGLSDKMEAAAKQYEALAADKEVKDLLAKVNEKAQPKLRLGPSSQFAQELPLVRKERERVTSGIVKFVVLGGTPHVEVILNGRAAQIMTVDSGAAFVTLSWETAKACGATPGAKDRTVTLHIASGKTIEARAVALKSVRVGQFLVENVPCVVLPENVPGSDLLGGTFLSHFLYRMDLRAGEIHMSQLVDKAEGQATTAAVAGATTQSTAATSRPATASTQRSAVVREIVVEALIDGNSKLHVIPKGIYWTSHGEAKPGLHDGANAPTFVNGATWTPTWSKPGDRGHDKSSVYPLNFDAASKFRVELVACGKQPGGSQIEKRDPIEAESAGGEVVITIPDHQVGSRWYRLRVFESR